MRIERLLADLEAEAAAQAHAEARAEVAESVRVEAARVGLDERLRAALGRQVSVTVPAAVLTGTLLDVGQGWVAVDRRATGSGRPDGIEAIVRPGVVVVPTAAIVAVAGLGRTHVAEAGSAIGRTWPSLLRAVARSRVPVGWHVAGVEPYVGRLEAVSADHVVLCTSGASGVRVALMRTALGWLELCAPSER